MSNDRGATWARDDDDLSLPSNWPGSTPRERYDRLSCVLPDGSYLAAGTVGPEKWGADRRAEAAGRGLNIFEDEETLSRAPTRSKGTEFTREL